MNARLGVVVYCLALAALAAACSPRSEPAPPPTKVAIVVFQNDVAGELNPNGPPTGAAGGMAVRHTYLRSVYRDKSAPAVILDAGDLFGRYAQEFGEDLKSLQRRADLMLDCLDDTQTDAFVPGEGDLAAGWDYLRKRLPEAKTKVLAANLVDTFTSEHPFDGSAVYERGGVRIGVVGVVSKTLNRNQPSVARREISIDDPVEAARREVESLAGKADLIVVAAHVDLEELKKVAAIPGIAFLISGHQIGLQSFTVDLDGAPPIFEVGSKGRYTGEILVVLKRPGESFADASHETKMTTQLSRIRKELDEMERRTGGVPPEDYFSSDAVSLKHYKALVSAAADLRKKLYALQSSNTFAFRTVTLTDRYARDPDIQARINALESDAKK